VYQMIISFFSMMIFTINLILIILSVASASDDNDNSCVDRNDSCSTMAKEGLCKSNITQMKYACAKTCRFCKMSDEYDSVAVSNENEENVYTIQKEKDIDEIVEKERNVNDVTDVESPTKCEDSDNEQCSKSDCLLHAQKMYRSCPETCGMCEMSAEELSKLLEEAQFGIPQLIGPLGAEGIAAILEETKSEYGEVDNSSCRNKDPQCAFWATRGYCETNYMKNNCRPVCQFCQ